jgi:hypothetical protein
MSQWINRVRTALFDRHGKRRISSKNRRALESFEMVKLVPLETREGADSGGTSGSIIDRHKDFPFMPPVTDDIPMDNDCT